MWNKREGILWLLILLFGSLSVYNYSQTTKTEDSIQNPKMGFVNLGIVFNEFELKKELENKLKSDLSTDKKILDSLSVELELLQSRLETEFNPNEVEIQKFQQKQALFYEKKRDFEIKSSEITQNYDARIIQQMNQFIKDFSKENGYDYVFGNDNSGVLLYGEELNDITKEVIAYINNKYEGNI